MSRGNIIYVLGVVLCVPALTVGWLSVRLLEQDAALESQRATERREQLSANAVQKLSTILSDPSLLLKRPGEGAILTLLPDGPLLYRNPVPIAPEPGSSAIVEAEAQEFQPGSIRAATDKYRAIAFSAEPALRAAALMRLGRSLRKLGRIDEALTAYNSLVTLDRTMAGEWPAALASRWSRCQIFEAAGRSVELRREAMLLRDLLLSGRYAITRSSYAGFADDVFRWTASSRPVLQEALTEAVLKLEQDVHEHTKPVSGRALVRVGGLPVTVVWQQRPASVVIFAADSNFVEREWLSQIGPGVWLRDDAGQDITSPDS
jgi:hypothetical protein